MRIISHSLTADIHRLMVACDLAIGAGGGSAWERCCVGLPTIMIGIADNQSDVAAALADAGAAIDLGPAQHRHGRKDRPGAFAIGWRLRASPGDVLARRSHLRRAGRAPRRRRAGALARPRWRAHHPASRRHGRRGSRIDGRRSRQSGVIRPIQSRPHGGAPELVQPQARRPRRRAVRDHRQGRRGREVGVLLRLDRFAREADGR